MHLLALFLELSNLPAFPFGESVTSPQQLLSLTSELFELAYRFGDCFGSTSGQKNQKVVKAVAMLQVLATELVGRLLDSMPHSPAWLVMATPAVADSLLTQMAAACSCLRKQLAVPPSPPPAGSGQQLRGAGGNHGRQKGKRKGPVAAANPVGPAGNSRGSSSGKAYVPKTFAELLLPPVGTSRGAALRLGQQAVDSIAALWLEKATKPIQVTFLYNQAVSLLLSLSKSMGSLEEPERASYTGFLAPLCAVPTLQLALEATVLLARSKGTDEAAGESLGALVCLLRLSGAAVWEGFIATHGALLLEVFWLMAEAAAVQRPDQHVVLAAHDICVLWLNLLLVPMTGVFRCSVLQMGCRSKLEGKRVSRCKMSRWSITDNTRFWLIKHSQCSRLALYS
jgi:hypothetical protein